MSNRNRVWVYLAFAILSLGATSFAQMPGMGGTGSSSFVGFGGHNMNYDLILPQVAVGQHYTTNLLLLSMANAQTMAWVPAQNLTTTGTVYLYHQDGTPMSVSVNGAASASSFAFSLGPSKTASYALSSVGADTSGWALIDIDEPSSGSGWGMMDGQAITRGMRLMADVYYAYSGPDQPASRVGVMPSMYELGRFDTCIISAQSSDNLYTGAAIVNTNSKPVSITLSLKDSAGNTLATNPMTLNPGTQMAKFINQLFSVTVPSNFQGYLEVDASDDGIVTMGLLVSQGIMTSIPMAHYGHISMMP